MFHSNEAEDRITVLATEDVGEKVTEIPAQDASVEAPVLKSKKPKVSTPKVKDAGDKTDLKGRDTREKSFAIKTKDVSRKKSRMREDSREGSGRVSRTISEDERRASRVEVGLIYLCFCR